MLQPKKGTISKISKKAKEMATKASQKYEKAKPSAPSLGKRTPIGKLKTKKATAVTTSPMEASEIVMKNSPASKPKMKTLKGKIQLALMKAKKG
jgi:hypothetical protein